MANRFYLKGREAFLKGTIAANSDTIKASLVSASAYTPNSSTDQFYTDMPSTVADSAGLASKTTNSPNPGTFDAADLTWSAVTGSQCDYVVLWKDTGTGSTSPLICIFDTGTNLPVTPNGGDITAQWSNGTDRIFTLLEAVDVEGILNAMTPLDAFMFFLAKCAGGSFKRFLPEGYRKHGNLWIPGGGPTLVHA